MLPAFKDVTVLVLVNTPLINHLTGKLVSFEVPILAILVLILYELLVRNCGGKLRKGPTEISCEGEDVITAV